MTGQKGKWMKNYPVIIIKTDTISKLQSDMRKILCAKKNLCTQKKILKKGFLLFFLLIFR